MAESDMAWRNNELRQQALNKLEDARKKSVTSSNMNVAEIENHAFQGAKSQEEYLTFIQKVLQRLQHGSTSDPGQSGALQNTVGIRPLSMQQRPGLAAFSNPTMMPRNAPMGIPRGEIFGMQPTRPGGLGPNPMVINPTIMPQNFPPMMQIKGQPTIMPMSASGGANAISGPIPSPAGVHIPGSLANVAMPSPGNALSTVSPGPHIVPSPANRGASTGIPSPGNLNTPGNPGSVGSVGGAAGGGPSKLSAAEEQAYLEKWKQLQKYIEPLKRMINRIDKDEDRNVDLNKMKNLLDILSDSTKRLPIQTLLKCEKVLEKQFLSQPTLAHPPAIPPLSVGSGDNMCQVLLDVVAAHMKSPTLNHTLQRTFGPAVRALHGPSISVETPPLKKRKVEDADDGFEIDDVIQGEIARLHHRFIVNLDSSYQSGSKVVLLQCKLEDRNLPSVPQIFISLPENYPHGNPVCLIKSNNYECSSFLQRVYRFLLLELNRLTGCYSLTALLNLWERSVRKACEPVIS